MISFEAFSNAKARLGGTSGTMVAGISSTSSLAAHAASFLPSSASFGWWDVVRVVASMKSANNIRAKGF